MDEFREWQAVQNASADSGQVVALNS